MIFFLLFPFLFNFCYFTNGEKATIAECDTVIQYYVKDDCVCITEYPKCLTSLISQGKCTKGGYPTNFIEEPCTKMYSKCSLTENECDICGCFELNKFEG
uniref:Uncharacterized protein n=1 Tax=Meloidogyne enterolobii TaxID=390850 RepID=A0A6V7UTF2_MELEN|nr:unnamed protein product [Meloidogyne enterolobii]